MLARWLGSEWEREYLGYLISQAMTQISIAASHAREQRRDPVRPEPDEIFSEDGL
jgi:hypothetical protein